ncbi:MAG: efflux RND transporter periplasmic adaptor subunit [Candidatus Eisenbacteria bacterium]|uniref:Efflux RND transporter periplasmic adaptor subunit n=1 Tax=Eiseniibacteriota bacterium TaxID=2212470 RepID=A0A538TH29_UNCEI|nr:MAG: efflux RND transporter periplasmic adaptor subunit [Candidatus Eisenbacteria bacterium]
MNQTSSRPWIRRWAWPLVGVILIAGAVAARSRLIRSAPKIAVTYETVGRRDITMSVESNGSVEPIDLVEVKSKASGQILKMPVQVGSVVKSGDLLAQIDKVDVQNQYDQAAAALQAAQTKVTISTAQKKRSDDLFASQVITAEEHEAAMLDLANSQSQLVKARTDLDIARQRLADATVRAPIAGTVLAQPVSVGQVISSATSSVSGGTTLLQMADLRRVRIRALVAESDIGSVHPEQEASVTVDAYPQRTFRGVVEKIEPQAVVQQSVTMFPVLVSISNEDGVLLPGMNGEVTVVADQRQNALAVSLDALRTMKELPVVAKALGLDPDSLQLALRAQRAARAGGAAGDSTGGSRGDRLAGGGRGTGGGGTAGGTRDWRAQRAARGGGGPLRGGAAGGARAAGDSAPSSARSRAQAMIAFARTDKGLELRIVRVGLSDFDYMEVLGGLKEGDQVAMLSVALLEAQRAESINQIRQRVSGGVTGVGGGGGGGAGGRGAGGGSGGPPGGR